MDCPDLTKRSVDDLVRDLAADKVETRDCAQAELARRSFDQPALEDELRVILAGIRDIDVLARLNAVLNGCRYYLRVCEVMALPEQGWWAEDVQFRFGTGPNATEVLTPDYHLEAGAWHKLGPAGVQIYSRAYLTEP